MVLFEYRTVPKVLPSAASPMSGCGFGSGLGLDITADARLQPGAIQPWRGFGVAALERVRCCTEVAYTCTVIVILNLVPVPAVAI